MKPKEEGKGMSECTDMRRLRADYEKIEWCVLDSVNQRMELEKENAILKRQIEILCTWGGYHGGLPAACTQLGLECPKGIIRKRKCWATLSRKHAEGVTC